MKPLRGVNLTVLKCLGTEAESAILRPYFCYVYRENIDSSTQEKLALTRILQ